MEKRNATQITYFKAGVTGKLHQLVDSDDKNADGTARFPRGRAKCAPFAHHANDPILTPNQVTPDEFCYLCKDGKG